MRTFLRGLVRYHRGLARMPLVLKPWLLLLLTLNMIVPLFFMAHLEAQVVFATAVLGGMTFSLLTGLFGFTRIIWLAHVVWIPLVIWLWLRLPAVAGDDVLFALWVRSVIAADLLSIFIDASNVVRYLRGERAEMVQGLP